MRVSSRQTMFVSPMQSAPLLGSLLIDGFHSFIIGLPQGRDKEEINHMSEHTILAVNIKYPILGR